MSLEFTIRRNSEPGRVAHFRPPEDNVTEPTLPRDWVSGATWRVGSLPLMCPPKPIQCEFSGSLRDPPLVASRVYW
jgi:hypothetical protein